MHQATGIDWAMDYEVNLGVFIWINVNVNVNVHVYSPDIPVGSADCTIYTPGIWNTLFYSLISSWENSAFAHFATAIANHYNSAFSFHQVPITAGLTEAAWYERLAQHLYTWPVAWLDRAAVTHPSSNRARRCLTSVISRELVTIRPCATTCDSRNCYQRQRVTDHRVQHVGYPWRKYQATSTGSWNKPGITMNNYVNVLF